MDNGLPPLPPITVRVPAEYPHCSVECNLSRYDGPSPLHTAIGQALKEALSSSHRTHTLSSVLSSWEHCIVMAMAEALSVQEE